MAIIVVYYMIYSLFSPYILVIKIRIQIIGLCYRMKNILTCSRCMTSQVSHCVSFGRRWSLLNTYGHAVMDHVLLQRCGQSSPYWKEQVRSMHGVNVWMDFSHEKKLFEGLYSIVIWKN